MSLPEHRRIVHGRTFSQSWTPASFDPIERYDSTDLGHATATILCVLILIGFALYMAATWGMQ